MISTQYVIYVCSFKCYVVLFFFFFFFQAEDGIRDVAVTGVQTCALPISLRGGGGGGSQLGWPTDAVPLGPQGAQHRQPVEPDGHAAPAGGGLRRGVAALRPHR